MKSKIRYLTHNISKIREIYSKIKLFGYTVVIELKCVTHKCARRKVCTFAQGTWSFSIICAIHNFEDYMI